MAVKQVFNTSAELDFPNVLPTLDLDFANSKTLDPRITFTRSSGGSYVGADGLIKYAGVNEARFDHDPETGESLGLLIEVARTNLVNNSLNGYINNFPSTATITTGIDAPDGTNTAIRFSCNNTGSSLLRVNTATLSNDVVYSASFYVRYISGNTISGSSPALTADICDGASINYLPLLIKDKWVKITFSGIRALTGFPQLNFLDLLSDRTNNYILDFWGAQVEQGSFPTSYIPTQGSTRTRAADIASITGKNFSEWYRQDEGTLLMDLYREYPVPPSNFLGGVQFRNSLNNGQSRISMGYLTEGQTSFEIWDNNIAQTRLFPGSFSGVRRRRTVASYKKNNFIILSNGRPRTISSSGSPPNDLDSVLIGLSLGGTTRVIKYYPKALTLSQLISLTT
jgi:hypothetical protein